MAAPPPPPGPSTWGCALPELAKYGITRDHLFDGCVSAYVAAWFYARAVKAKGDTWAAVGTYHSATPDLRNAYANYVAAILARWQVVPKGFKPFPNDANSSAEALRRRPGQASAKAPTRPASPAAPGGGIFAQLD